MAHHTRLLVLLPTSNSRQVGRIDGPVFYKPAALAKLTGHSFLVRTNENQRGVVSAVREVMLSLDKDVLFRLSRWRKTCGACWNRREWAPGFPDQLVCWHC